MKKIMILCLLTLATIILLGCSAKPPTTEVVQVFKSATCSCCATYIAELKNQGYQVTETNTADMTAIKKKYNIPSFLESCHTAVIGKYVIEGHVSFKAVKKLLEEQPDIDGIALPGMPQGSPGMPGPKQQPFKIYAIKNGNPSEFMVI